MKLLVPDLYVSDVLRVDLDALYAEGVDTLLIDLDNTLLPRNGTQAPSRIIDWLKGVEDQGFAICLVSNNWHASAITAAEKLGVRIVAKASKPLPFAFKKALSMLDSEPRRTAVIGDQIFTDVLGGNLMGMKTVLVRPLSATDLPHTLLLRRLEAVVLAGREPLS
ncbi:MAG: YqeG family HAD IIIA-type phosphatase [Actinobacteria bacterium]|nr:YqeG family HAD IIIA-type phosphatase [Actinomycetota bacterium]